MRMKWIRCANLRVLTALFVMGLVCGVANADDVIWSAYNDCLKEDGDSTDPKVTRWTIHKDDDFHYYGRLNNFATDSNDGMPWVSFTMYNDVGTSGGGAGSEPASGTPAYEIFNNIVDFHPNLVDYGGEGWWVEIEFTGLDPTKTYSFVGTAIRYRDYPERITLITIEDADTYTNNSSIPAGHPDWVGTDTTKLQAGNNSSTGYVVRWDDIVPGADGDFTVRSEAAPGSDGGKAYPINGFMLQERGTLGNQAPIVDAGDDQTKWLRSSSVTVRLAGSVDPDGYLAMQWSWTGGSAEGPILFDPNNAVKDPNFTVYNPGTYELELEADDGEDTGSDTVTITVREGLKGDLFIDNKIDWRDMLLFSQLWLDGPGSAADLVDNDGVDGVDYAVLVNNWWMQTYDALVEISEFMADNEDTIFTIYEPGGEQHSPDWIEIYNFDVNAVDLGGWYLTDDVDEPNKWQFPAGFTIEGGGYKIVFASGQGDSVDQFVDPYGYYHTNFQLRKDGEYLALVSPESLEAVHEFTDYEYSNDKFGFPPQEEDYSYGLLGSLKRYFSTPTPGAENVDAFDGFVADTKFSHDRGFYYGPFDVTIVTDTSGATIFYTTDDSPPLNTDGTPTATATEYVSQVPITTTTPLRAAAVKFGWMPTNIDTQTYIFPDHVLEQATDPESGDQVVPTGYPADWGWNSKLDRIEPGDYQVDPEIVNHLNPDDRFYADDLRAVPTFSLVLDYEDLFGSNQIYLSGDGSERLCSIEMIYPDGSTGFQENGTVQIQGGSSVKRWKVKKLSMRFKFKEFMKNGTPTGGTRKLNHQLYPDAPIDTYDNIIFDSVLNNSWTHGTSSDQRNNCMFIQDQYVGDLHNAMGGHSPRGLFAHIYLNGLYWGMYYVHDRPDHAWAEEMFGGDKEEQHALKHNKELINNGNGNSAVSNYNAMLSAGTNAGNNPTDLAKWEALTDKLDVDNFITYILAHWIPGTDDWCSDTSAKNIYYTCRDGSEGRWRFHTWDAEHTMKFEAKGFEKSPHGLHKKLRDNVEYKTRFGDLIHRFFYNDGPMAGLGPYNLYQARMTEIDRAIVGESARWGDAWDSTPHTRQDWLDVQAGKLSELDGRPEDVLDMLKGVGLYPSLAAPEFSQHGGASPTALDIDITISGGGTIYYTTDGNDPRLPGGVTNPDAPTIGSGSSVHLDKSTHLKARAKSGSTWSALNEAVFVIHPLTDYLRISEIMYHPQETGNPDDPNEEFIELTNIGGTPINLNLVRFTNGIDFTFGDIDLDPDEYVVVVAEQTAFEAKYPSFPGVFAGEYTGRLDNGGERIELADALGWSILNFKYKDGWRSITDGQGFSLTIVDPANPDPNSWGEKDSWRASAYIGGSPGWDDSGTLPNPGAVVINEILAHSHGIEVDWIELHNTTDSQIDIGGWYLSDSQAFLKKYRFADGTKIDAHDYLVLYEDPNFGDSSSDPGKIMGFAFSENGDQAYLSSAEDGVLTGYRAVEDFGASYTGISFGRYYKSSTNSYNFVPMDHNTPRVANAYPKVGPVVINEIMYNPDWPTGGMYANDGYEFIELYNVTASDVNLYRDDKALPWKFSEGIDFVFPDAPVTIAADDYIVVVRDVDAFMWLYPSVPAEKIFGPYDGKLSNGGERVEISMPGDVDMFGRQHYIRIDRVVYSDGSHHEDAPGGIDLWPIEADGGGKSLSRTAPELYGNDPNNWTAVAPPTPAGP